MTKVKKPATVAEWEKVCSNLNATLTQSIAYEDELRQEIDDLEEDLNTYCEKLDDLSKQLTMSLGVIKYLEVQLEQSKQLKISGDED